MLLLDNTEVKHCKLKDKENLIPGVIYSNKIFTRAKAFPKEELEVAIKECRENFLDHEERSKIPTLLIKGKTTVGIWMENKRYKKEDIIQASGDRQSSSIKSAEQDSSKSTTDTSRISTRQIASKMRSDKGVEIKTRRHKLKLYQRCFLGNEAVDWISKEVKISRSDAIKVGQKMLEKGFFSHVTDDHNFKDEGLFYRFNEDKDKSIWNSNV
ncbi:hypothetical protein I4641_11185 [Waterburya agarophytonicola K14]|uniref:DEP domain-containing protein n=1 Tax=Waterburya agarophytonicola KI4 TaxID=2874699 RepID=A0A964BSR9_9CYAN|nr:hypothetical protein [Waterburya agarophytonicola]MCC0177541.1 hypothetical protein [Waterburya agarophytonicola KI4]